MYGCQVPRPIHPEFQGLRRSWVSNARVWSVTARRLWNGASFAEVQLGVVATYLCLHATCNLVDGTGDVPADRTARGDCPIDPRRLRQLRDRLAKIRDLILHLADRRDSGSEVRTAFQAARPRVTVTASLVGPPARNHSTNIDEIEATLDALDEWLIRHWNRLVLGGTVAESAQSRLGDADGSPIPPTPSDPTESANSS